MATTDEIIIPPKEECISKDDPRKFLVISYDFEMTGLNPEDEIVQIGAYHAADPRAPQKFNQFVLPATRKVHPEASLKIGLQINTISGRRFLVDTRLGKQLPTVAVDDALKLFLNWLKLQLAEQHGRYDAIVLLSHGAIFLDIPALIHALRKFNMTQQLYEVVCGFCDSNAIFKEDQTGRYQAHSLQRLYESIMGRTRNGAHRAEGDATDLYHMLLKLFRVNSLSLPECKALARYTYTPSCMEKYVRWQDLLERRHRELLVLLSYIPIGNNRKRRNIFIKNLLAAGYDMSTLEKEFFETAGGSLQKLRRNLGNSINHMKQTYESYLTDTKGLSADEVAKFVSDYFMCNRYRRYRPTSQ